MTNKAYYWIWLVCSYLNVVSAIGMAVKHDWKCFVWFLLAVIYRVVAELFKRKMEAENEAAG